MCSLNKSSINLALFLSQIIVLYFSCTTAQPDFTSRVCQDTFGNYTSNSTFAKNLHILLSNITSNTKLDYGFYNYSVGKDFDVVNGIGLCRPDLLLNDCQQCLQQAAEEIVIQCPNQKDAIGWYGVKCMIRYTDRYIYGKLEFGPWYYLHNSFLGVTTISKASFNHTAATLLKKLQKEAASGDSRLKYGAGKANVTSSYELYALVQCTPDLDYFDCYTCLDQAIGFALSKFYGVEATVCYVSCNIEYGSVLFYDPSTLISLKPPSLPPVPASPPSSSTQSSKGKSNKKSSKVLIVVLLPVITTLILFSACIACYFWRRRATTRKKYLRKFEGDEIVRKPEALQMDFDTIRVATENFSSGNKLGEGGFGIVFKGRLADGQDVAVKRLSKRSGQGEEEFKNEAVLVAKLRHRNLVRFLGFCLERQERLLIYELLPNRSLDYFLFDPIKRRLLDWQTRYKIIGGIARGLLYLHEDSRLLVVHRDLKAGNILLDKEMNPKISDFGMAKLFGEDQSRADTKRICGTYGYMPPEYVQRGQFSFKSDVYGFGVLLLEIVSGQRISSFFNAETGESLLSYAWRNWLEDTALNIVDTSMSVVDTSEVLRCIHIGLLCVQENLTHRPIMSFIILLLNSQYTISPPMPSRPAFLLRSNDVNLNESKAAMMRHNSSELASSNESRNEVSQSELDPR